MKKRRILRSFWLASVVLFGSGYVPNVESADNSDRVARLIRRVNEYNNYYRERDRGRLCEMMVSEYQRFQRDKGVPQECVLDEVPWKRFKLRSWEIDTIWVYGSHAKVRLRLSGRVKIFLFFSKKMTGEEDEYWLFENGDWFKFIEQLDDFDETKARMISVARQPDLNGIEALESNDH